MSNRKKANQSYIHLMLALFGAAAMSILLFFVLFRFDGIAQTFRKLQNVLMPFIIGAVIAYILKPSCNFIEEKLTIFFSKQKKAPMKLIPGLSVLLTMALGLAVILILLVMVLPTLLDSIYSVVRLIPSSMEAASDWLLQYFDDNETLSNYIQEFSESFSTSIPSWIRTNVIPNIEILIGNISSSVSSVVSIFSNVLIGLIAAIYILGSRKKFASQARLINYSVFGKKWAGRILREVQYTDKVFSGYINGRLIDSLIIGIICFIGMLIFRMPYAMLVSVIVGVTNIIPFFGPYIGAIPSFLLILMVTPVKAVIFLVFVLILQQFDGNILGPRILGNVTGLSSFWVLFAILTFGGLFGFIGVIIGVPVFAVIYDIIRKLVKYGVTRREQNNQEPPASQNMESEEESNCP
ncbi:MAG: AI-2E family transporter [Lachnospiraceae bacterium]|nr:AI-2E family transporter [Lachnospiraceae bacterium]